MVVSALHFLKSSGSLAMLAAIRRASSRVISLVAARRAAAVLPCCHAA